MAWHGAVAFVLFATLILVLVKLFGVRVRGDNGRDSRPTAVLVRPVGLQVQGRVLHPLASGMAYFAKVAVGKGERSFSPTGS
jgi:hypothetical protein